MCIITVLDAFFFRAKKVGLPSNAINLKLSYSKIVQCKYDLIRSQTEFQQNNQDLH